MVLSMSSLTIVAFGTGSIVGVKVSLGLVKHDPDSATTTIESPGERPVVRYVFEGPFCTEVSFTKNS